MVETSEGLWTQFANFSSNILPMFRPEAEPDTNQREGADIISGGQPTKSF